MANPAFITRRHIAVAIGLAYAGSTLPAYAQPLDCPIPQPVARQGGLQESPAQIVETGGLLASGDTGNRVRVVIADLRKRHPGVPDAEIENYLVTAYCPAVARLDGLSVAEQRRRVELFAREVSAAVHGG